MPTARCRSNFKIRTLMSKFQIVIDHIKSIISSPRAYFSTFCSMKPSTDLKRWSSPDNLDPDWDERTALIAALVPAGSSVIEFGAARLVLQQHLDPSCTYQPVDLVKRSEDTIVFDLNGTLLDLPRHYDIAVFSGVLEYVHDLKRTLGWLATVSDSVLLSYAVRDLLSDPITRRQAGWVNSFSESEIRRLLEGVGLKIISTRRWLKQIIFFCRFETSHVELGTTVA